MAGGSVHRLARRRPGPRCSGGTRSAAARRLLDARCPAGDVTGAAASARPGSRRGRRQALRVGHLPRAVRDRRRQTCRASLVRALVPEPDPGRDPLRSIAGRCSASRTWSCWIPSSTCWHRPACSTSCSTPVPGCSCWSPAGPAALPGRERRSCRRAADRTDGAATAMFRERARAVGGLRLATATTNGRVAALCDLLEGSPLAIELAAARTTMFTVAALFAALQAGGPEPAAHAGGGTAPRRHRDMRSTIAWSYQLLGEPGPAPAGAWRCSPAPSTWTRRVRRRAIRCEQDHRRAGRRRAATSWVTWWTGIWPSPRAAQPSPPLPAARHHTGVRRRQLRSGGELGAAQDACCAGAWTSPSTPSPAPIAAERRWLEHTDRELPNLRPRCACCRSGDGLAASGSPRPSGRSGPTAAR